MKALGKGSFEKSWKQVNWAFIKPLPCATFVLGTGETRRTWYIWMGDEVSNYPLRYIIIQIQFLSGTVEEMYKFQESGSDV